MNDAAAVALDQYSAESMQKGSLSFTFASKIFSKKIRSRVVRLYAWCRYVDNRVDSLPLTATGEERQTLLDELIRDSFAMPPPPQLHPAMRAFRDVWQEVKFPESQARELILGMAMDLNQVHYETEEQLLLYCYRVAGVVGLMMSYVMDAQSSEAFGPATDLGIAMQLTNIARDIAEDAALGRVYLPRQWLNKAGIPEDRSLRDPVFRPALVATVERALKLADRRYASADRGLRYLPLRCALAVAVAREVYAAIGHEVRRRQGQAWNERVWIPWPQKIRVALRGIRSVLKTLPYRWSHRTQGLVTKERMVVHE